MLISNPNSEAFYATLPANIIFLPSFFSTTPIRFTNSIRPQDTLATLIPLSSNPCSAPLWQLIDYGCQTDVCERLFPIRTKIMIMMDSK